ncbi:sodium:proton antiporter, partial [Streptococcus agalactiae]|nr:sodium:proton antiporter [Streptococcus agalactiae]
YLERQVNRSFVSNITYSLTILMRVIRGIVHEFLTFGQGIRNRKKHFKNRKRLLAEVNRQHLTDLYLSNNDLILETLEDMEGYYNATLIDFLQNERIRDAELIKSGLFVERVIARITPDILNETLRGYYLERRTISEFERDGLI